MHVVEDSFLVDKRIVPLRHSFVDPQHFWLVSIKTPGCCAFPTASQLLFQLPDLVVDLLECFFFADLCNHKLVIVHTDELPDSPSSGNP